MPEDTTDLDEILKRLAASRRRHPPPLVDCSNRAHGQSDDVLAGP